MFDNPVVVVGLVDLANDLFVVVVGTTALLEVVAAAADEKGLRFKLEGWLTLTPREGLGTAELGLEDIEAWKKDEIMMQGCRARARS